MLSPLPIINGVQDQIKVTGDLDNIVQTTVGFLTKVMDEHPYLVVILVLGIALIFTLKTFLRRNR